LEKKILSSVPPQNEASFWDAESRDGKKEEKTIGGFKIAKKIVLSPVLEKDFVSCDTLLGACRKVIYWCNRSRVVHKFFEGD